MGKYQKKRKQKGVIPMVIMIVVIALLLAAFVLFVMPQLLYRMSGAEESEIPETRPTVVETQIRETTEPTVPTVSFPVSLCDGSLEVESLFQFDGINPDSGNQEGSNIASIMLKNTGTAYVAEATVTMTLEDGTQLVFVATDLPAGKSAMVFSRDNASLVDNAKCISAEATASFDTTASAESDKVAVTVSGMTVTVTNTSAETISEVVVYCRSPLGEEYFGGITYQYTVNELPAYASTTFEATDCILGVVEVVRVVIN